MKEDLLKQAISGRKIVSFMYNDKLRMVCPAKYGVLTNESKVIEGYCIGGYSKSGNLPNWRIYYLKNIRDIKISNKTFDKVPGYNPRDNRFSVIYTQI